MVKSKTLFASALVALFMLVPMNALGSGLSPVGPIVNGEFENPVVPPVVSDALDGSALDTCFGIGHQVFWGEDTAQGDLAGGDPENIGSEDPDPEGAANRVQDDPEGEAKRFAGHDECVYNDDDGRDLIWLTPIMKTRQPTHWSLDPNDPGVEFGYDLDTDPFDREAVFRAGEGSVMNMWQAYPSPFQAFTANFDALTLTVEDGVIPDAASIRISLSAVPGETVNDRVLLYQDCVLVFHGEDLKANMVGDDVVMDPLDAVFQSTHANCPDYAGASSDDERRDILGDLRIVQFTFWRWNQGDVDVVVDDVQLDGATTIAEEIL